jgi:hypothetical protein
MVIWRCRPLREFSELLPKSLPKFTTLGLQKHGKTLFYRDFLHHLRHSSDDFVIAPGIRGLVMLVFTLPSYPYVFKVIKDVISPPKDTDRKQVMGKYLLVKYHDRVGRMADTLEYKDVAFEDRFAPRWGAVRSRDRDRRGRRHADRQARVHRAAHGAAQYASGRRQRRPGGARH